MPSKKYVIGNMEVEIPSVVQGISQDHSGGLTVQKEVLHPIQRYIEMGDSINAMYEMQDLGLSYIRQAIGTKVRASEENDPLHSVRILQTTVGLSNELEEGTFSIDGTKRIVLPAKWAVSRDIDCDGDPITGILWKIVLASKDNDGVIVTNSTEYGLFAKMPPTKIMPVLRRVPQPAPILKGMLNDDVNAIINADPEVLDFDQAMDKTYCAKPVGLVTSRWWSFILGESIFLSKQEDLPFIKAFEITFEKYSDAYRNDLEGKVMKAASKGGGAVERPSIYDKVVFSATPLCMSLYGSRNSIDRAVGSATVAKINDLLNLKSEGMFGNYGGKYNEQETAPKAWTNEDEIGDPDLVGWLIKDGRIRVDSIEHKRQGLPAAMAFSLYSIEAKSYSSFIWTKDTGEAQSGYVVMLYPTFAYNPYTKKAEIMSPLKHMNLWLSRHYGCSKIYSSNYLKSVFSGGGARALERSVRKYVENFGDVLPSYKVGGKHQAHPIGKYFASFTVTVDHSSNPIWREEIPLAEMKAFALEADKAFGGIHLPSTASRRLCRKHFIAEADGLPPFIRKPEGITPCAAHRPGRNRSLLVRSVAAAKCLTAIVDNGDSIQCFITPSGAEKSQPKHDVFLPEVTFEEKEGFIFKAFHSWNGAVRYAWVSPNAKQDAKWVGKFICPNGNRFEPIAIKQCFAEIDEVDCEATTSRLPEVDMLMTTAELADKHLLQLFLSQSKVGTLVTGDGKRIENVRFVEWTFFRSGTASENIKPRWLTSWTLTGFVGLILAASMNRIKLPFSRHDKKLLERGKVLIDQSYQIGREMLRAGKIKGVEAKDDTPRPL